MANDCIKREQTIDFARFISLSLIFLAHVNPPFFILQLRCFDVPLIIFVSGLVMSERGIDLKDYWPYIKKRVLRLLVPTYIFLSFYFIIAYILFSFRIISVEYGLKTILSSYLLMYGIGFVWILRVFLILMLLTPILQYINNRIVSIKSFFLLLLLILVGQELLVILFREIASYKLSSILGEYILYMSYSFMFLLGLRAKKTSNKILKVFFLSFLLANLFAFSYWMIEKGTPICLSPIYKYPPRSYFLFYGGLMSLLIWILLKKIPISLISNRYLNVPSFIGRNTIWLYLWHIPFVGVVNSYLDNWMVKWAFLYLLAIICYWVQCRIIHYIERRGSGSMKWLKYMKG